MTEYTGVVRRNQVTTGLKTLLEEATSFPVGVARAPERADGSQEPFPYIVIMPRPRGLYSGPEYENSFADVHLEYSVISFGQREDQAEICADRVREAILAKDEFGAYAFDLDVGPGQSVMNRWPDSYSPGGVQPAGTIFEVDDSFVIAITTS